MLFIIIIILLAIVFSLYDVSEKELNKDINDYERIMKRKYE